MKITVKTQGFRELDAALSEFSKATARNVLRRAGIAALEPVADAMKARAPEESGDLIDAIQVGTKLGKRQKRQNRSPSNVEVYVGVADVNGKHVPAGTQQEFGNENHPPQPFARPAWDREATPTLDRLKDSLGAEIDKAADRARRKALKAKG